MAPARTMHWFRWHHGTAYDPKWRIIAVKAGVAIPIVLAVWAMILEHASAGEERGLVDGWCHEDEAAALDIDTDQVKAVWDAMQGKVLDGTQVISWAKRQPKREREDCSTPRTQKHRNGVPDERTPGNAKKRQGTPRLEERRGEKKRELQQPSSGSSNTEPSLPTNWVAQLCADYTDVTEGHIPPGEVGRTLKPLIATHGHEETRARWLAFIRHADVRFGVQYFAKHFGQYKAGADLVGVGGNEAEVVAFLGLNR